MKLRNRIVNVYTLAALITAISAALGFALHSESVSAGGPTTVIATGLNNPRGIDIGPDGSLFVAEAGVGGSGPCADGPEGMRCYGASGAIARVDLQDGTLTRVTADMPSLASPDGSFATGVHDVSFLGLGNGHFTTGFGGNPSDRADFGPAGGDFARVGRISAKKGKWSLLEDMGEYETANNPAGDEVDTNPYGVLSLPGRQVVADAGANALNQITTNGEISTLAIFPDRLVDAPPFLELPPGTQIPMDAVPTSVALGPDGNYYVGQLTGFPFPVGGANIYRVPAQGGMAVAVEGGFTAVIDVTFGPDGSMYVLEIAKNGLLAAFGDGDWTGALIRIYPDGTRTELASGTLFAPGGVTVNDDGTIYVTNNSIFSGSGQVIRIEQ